jgi:hypothetical protein
MDPSCVYLHLPVFGVMCDSRFRAAQTWVDERKVLKDGKKKGKPFLREGEKEDTWTPSIMDGDEDR